LHAETALVEAELGLLCTERSNQTDVGAPPLLAKQSQSPGGTTDLATGMQRIKPQIARRAAPARRSGKDKIAYAVHCWAPNSTFTDPLCNCLGEAAHPNFGSRPTIRIIVGSWYGPPAPSIGCDSMSWLWDSFLATVPRLGAAVDSFLLKILIEGRLGYPVQLLSDGQLADVWPGLTISNVSGGIYSALARGEIDMYPEVTPVDTAHALEVRRPLEYSRG
jgi:hypothetical protein